MLTLPTAKNSSFYTALQSNACLDLRDNRGKRHDLSLILLGVMIGLLRGRDGNLSSIHRSMENTQSRLCSALGIADRKVVSRSHLPIVLSGVDLAIFESLVFEHYGLELPFEVKKWFAGDGKELRGSIGKGAKRGQAMVQLVSHEEREVVAQGFYQGQKESEIPTLRALLAQGPWQNQKISLDALHLNPETLGSIEQGGGRFLVGLKENQEELLADMKGLTKRRKPLAHAHKTEKGHGRLEIRNYKAFEVNDQYFDPRWEEQAVSFQSLIQVRRVTTQLKTGKQSDETAYFLSNAAPHQAAELFEAVRKHWSVEVNNHYRDVTLKEDQLRTKKTPSPKLWRHCEPL